MAPPFDPALRLRETAPPFLAFFLGLGEAPMEEDLVVVLLLASAAAVVVASLSLTSELFLLPVGLFFFLPLVEV